jgi:GxxExxY protein
MEFDELSRSVIGCAIEVHRTLGPGLLKSTYRQCLAYELSEAQIPFQMEAPLPVRYKNILLDCGYRIDLLVSANLIVEIKSVETAVANPSSANPHLHAASQHSSWSADKLQRYQTTERH